MSRTIVTYETFHGSARKIAQIIGDKINCKVINVDTPFEAENLTEVDNIVLVFNFRGPYTAQLTKLYLSRVKNALINKNLILVGEGLFSEKEFPVVAEEISKNNPSRTFTKFFVKGQLRTEILFPEEKALLKKFSEITKMEIKDMGELDIDKATEIASEINDLIDSDLFKENNSFDESETINEKWVCPICGYVHTGKTAPDACPLCGAPASLFKKEQ